MIEASAGLSGPGGALAGPWIRPAVARRLRAGASRACPYLAGLRGVPALDSDGSVGAGSLSVA
jgi:hypothetical protein